MITLPFKLELNAPISKVLKSNQQPTKYDKQLVFALNRLFKHKLRNAFISIKTSQLRSPTSYFKFVLASVKQTKRESRISYPTYSPQLPPTQPQIPKTPIFNHRVKSMKNDAFLKLKQFSLNTKSSQVSTVVTNRQNQLLNHFIPKIEQKIYTIVFRAIADYAKQKKGKNKIVRLMDKLEKNIVKRVFFSEFMNKLKGISSKEGKQKLACQKFVKILSLSQRFSLQQSVRKLQSYQQSLNFQVSQLQKKQRISRIHQANSERTVTVQKQRQALRNLKYKLDQQSIQKNHILTQKRRSLMLAKTKFTQQSKQLSQHSLVVSSQVQRLSAILAKQSHILSTLEQNKSLITQLSQHGIDFQSVTLTIYKAIYDVGEEGFQGFREIVKHHQKKWQHVEGMVGWEGVKGMRECMGRKIAILEKNLKVFQKRQGQSEMNASRFKPLGSTASASQLKFSPSTSSLKGSRIATSQYNPKSRIQPDPSQLTRLKEQYSALQSFISLILTKSYELKINQAITAQIEQLSELLASDLKENKEE